jgi:hypothetical protein
VGPFAARNSLHGIKAKAKMNGLPHFDAATLLDSPDLKSPSGD